MEVLDGRTSADSRALLEGLVGVRVGWVLAGPLLHLQDLVLARYCAFDLWGGQLVVRSVLHETNEFIDYGVFEVAQTAGSGNSTLMEDVSAISINPVMTVQGVELQEGRERGDREDVLFHSRVRLVGDTHTLDLEHGPPAFGGPLGIHLRPL